MSEKKGKKRPKSYYIKCANKKPKREVWKLEAGMKGFLITCNNNEKAAVREAYNILNEYADKLYGPEKEITDMRNEEDSSEEDVEEEDIEKAMMKEVNEIKEKKLTQRRFQNTNTKAKNCIFIRTTLSDPSQLAHSILSDLSETKVQKSRYAIRLLPISGSCRAEEADVKKLGKELFTPIFETPYGKGYSFSITVKVRNNNGLGRDSVIPALAGIVKELNPLHRVSHDHPDFVILVEVIQSVCCIGIVKDFFKFRKYNLQEIVKKSVESKENSEDLSKDENVDGVDDKGDNNQATEQNKTQVCEENTKEEQETVDTQCSGIKETEAEDPSVIECVNEKSSDTNCKSTEILIEVDKTNAATKTEDASVNVEPIHESD
ncbi:THUMP domain-containing protein 1-like [Saccostrea echinata]|uniref:THUMP domain-containing protein 1-like n=1 Tax=Saccostrea echinata TaxID=191078 RepID=UPI002A82F1B7|nr:THUMP domain-containing protein 1-like [Saccostrea echinata]